MSNKSKAQIGKPSVAVLEMQKPSVVGADGLEMQMMPGPGGQMMQMMPPMVGQMFGVPPGLEYLAVLDRVIVKQQIELMEVLTGCETKNRYIVSNSMGQQIFYAHEESGFFMRLFCKDLRGYLLHITDMAQNQILLIERPFQCCKYHPWFMGKDKCCAYPTFVYDSQHSLLGSVYLEWSCLHPTFGLYDERGVKLYEAKGPCCQPQGPCCQKSQDFPLINVASMAQEGVIAKHWKGMLQEVFTDADTFSLTFPLMLPVKLKALMFGALFVIDYAVFERGK